MNNYKEYRFEVTINILKKNDCASDEILREYVQDAVESSFGNLSPLDDVSISMDDADVSVSSMN